jgi:hypothetical protein
MAPRESQPLANRVGLSEAKTFVSRTLTDEGSIGLPSSFLFGGRTPALKSSRRGSLLRWSCCGWRRLTGAARVPSLMATGAPR